MQLGAQGGEQVCVGVRARGEDHEAVRGQVRGQPAQRVRLVVCSDAIKPVQNDQERPGNCSNQVSELRERLVCVCECVCVCVCV